PASRRTWRRARASSRPGSSALSMPCSAAVSYLDNARSARRSEPDREDFPAKTGKRHLASLRRQPVKCRGPGREDAPAAERPMIGRIGLGALGAVLLPLTAAAQTAPAAPAQSAPAVTVPQITLPPLQVIGATPLPGTGIDIDKVPANVQSLTTRDLSREGSPSLLDSAQSQLGSVNFNGNLNDQFQPDLLFRGFEASPVLGTPQGLAVYQNGVRVNEGFGDTVNWDLIPDFAIDRFDLVSSNPVYGLNALGGAALVT